MSQSFTFQVLSPGDGEAIHAFALAQLRARGGDDVDVIFNSWSARWRPESLEHYLKLGWSIIAREGEKTAGFFLAQPFLFFRGQTQTLWIEHIEVTSEAARAALIEVAVKMSREKHLQRVICEPNVAGGAEISKLFGPSAILLEDKWIEVKTTKG